MHRQAIDKKSTGTLPPPHLLPFAILCATILVFPFIPDEKIVRLKLLILELGIFSSVFVGVVESIWRHNLKIRAPRVVLAALAYPLIVIGLAIFSDHPPLATFELRRVFLAFGAFWVTSQYLGDHQQKKWILGIWATSAALAASYGILQKFGGIGQITVPQMDRVMSTFGNPILFGAYLVSSLGISWTFISILESRRSQVLAGVAFLLIAWALFLSKTRASWIGALSMGFLYAAWFPLQKRKKLFLLGFLLILLVGGLFFSGALRQSSVWLRDQGHFMIWRDTLRLWTDHPFLGVGPGEFHIHFPSYAGDDLKAKWPQDSTIINYAHNEYLQILSETGIFGLTALGLVLFLIYRSSRIIIREGGDLRQTWILKGLLVTITGLLIQSMFSVDMRFSISFAILFLVLGILSSFENSVHFKLPSTLWIKTTLTASTLFLFGLLGFRTGASGGIHFLGIFRITPSGQVESFPKLLGPGLLPKLLQPYVAQKKSRSRLGFFDETLLNADRTIRELEELTHQFPEEPSIFDKLGYSLAKEIQKTSPSGEKKIQPNTAQKAIQAYQRCVALDPSRAGCWNNLGNIYFTLSPTKKNDPSVSKALIYWEKAALANPQLIDPRLNRGKILYLQGHLRASAEEFKAVLKLDPNNSDAIVFLKKMVE